MKSQFSARRAQLLVRYSVVLVAVITAVNGCKTSSSPEHDATLAGQVLLIDSSGLILPNSAGIAIQIDGTNKSTLTDSTGQWKIGGLQEGEYDISASRVGFGTYHWYQQHIES